MYTENIDIVGKKGEENQAKNIHEIEKKQHVEGRP
jgi:hypothetical protein